MDVDNFKIDILTSPYSLEPPDSYRTHVVSNLQTPTSVR